MDAPAATPNAPSPLRPLGRLMIWMPSKHMGNLLVSLQSVVTLLEEHPDHTCALVVDTVYGDLVEAAGLPVHIIRFPRQATRRGQRWQRMRALWRFVRIIRAFRADTAVSLEGDATSHRFMLLSGARRRIGPATRYRRGLHRTMPLDHGQRHRFYDYAAVTAALCQRPPPPGYPRLSASAANRRLVASALAEAGVAEEQALAVLHCGATKDYKQWPSRQFARLAQWLHDRGFAVALTGAGASDCATIDELLHHATSPMIDLHGRLGLPQLIALCERAQVFVGNDTGPTHLAAATGTRTFALFGPTDEHAWGPLGEHVTIVRNREQPCAPECSRRDCTLNYRCLRQLDAERVAAMLEPGL